MKNVHCIVNKVHCIVYNVHCSVHIVHCTMNTRIAQTPTFTKLLTADLTTCTGLPRSGIALPSSASSWRITSLDTWGEEGRCEDRGDEM